MNMLERDPYLATLHDHLRQAANGKGRLVFLGGEAGGGKTTLVEHFAASIRHEAPAAIVACDGLRMTVSSARSSPRCGMLPAPTCSLARMLTGPTRHRSS
jgi:Ni2+-binding GTPase involved in maturation of urease and hydrogenase